MFVIRDTTQKQDRPALTQEYAAQQTAESVLARREQIRFLRYLVSVFFLIRVDPLP